MQVAGKAIRAMIWDFLGKGSLTLMRFAEAVLLVRLLGGNDYGLLSALLNFQATLLLLGALGLEGCLSRFIPQFQVQKTEQAIHLLIWRVWQVRLVVLVLVGGLVLAFAPFWLRLILESQGPELEGLSWPMTLVGFLFVTLSLQELSRRILAIFYQQKFINLVETLSFGIYLGITVLVLLQGGGLTEVLAINLIVRLVGTALMLLKSRTHWNIPRQSVDLPQRAIASFAFFYFLYALMIHVLGKGADIFLLGALVPDPRQTAWYTLAYNFAFFSTSFFELALQGGFVQPLVTEVYHRGDHAQMQKVYTGLFEFIYLFTLPIAAGGVVLSQGLIEVFFGAENLAAAPLLLLLLIHLAIAKIGILNANFLLASDQQGVLIRSRVGFGVFNVVLNLLLIERYQALGVVVGTVITGFLSHAYESWVVHRWMKPRYSWNFLLKVGAASVLMALVCASLWHWLPWVSWLKLGFSVLVGMGVFAMLVVVLKPVSPENLDALSRSSMPLKKQLFRLLSRSP